MTPREELSFRLQHLVSLTINCYEKNKHKSPSDKDFDHESYDFVKKDFQAILDKWAPKDESSIN